LSRISFKIISIIILSIVLVSSSIGILSSYRASHIIKEETHEKLRYMAKNYANQFSLVLTGVENTVRTISSVVSADFDIEAFAEDADYRREYMSVTDSILYKIGINNAFIQGIYLAVNPELTGEVFESWFIHDSYGNFIYQEAEDISTFYPENEDMRWYYDPIGKHEGSWSLPYTDATINVKMISFTKAIYNNDQLIGVVGIDISIDDIITMVKNFIFYETGYGVLLDNDYNIIVHPDLIEGINIRTLENEDMDLVVDALNRNDSEVLTYYYKKTDKIMGFSKLSNDWIFMAVASIEEINKHVIKLRQNIAVVVLLSMLIVIAISMKMTRSITIGLNILNKITDQIENGNFEAAVESSSDDEIGKLTQKFSIMSRKFAASQNELIALNKDMEFMAFHDPLTHLPNRRYGMNQLSSMLGEYHESLDICGIMFIDLDNFKQINDSLGHDAGDEVLLHASEMMNHKIGNYDSLCRLGGDEFMIIFRKVPDMKLLKAMAGRLLDSVNEPFTIHKETINTSCSIGIMIIDRVNLKIGTVLKHADDAMYKAKESGRNTYRFYGMDK